MPKLSWRDHVCLVRARLQDKEGSGERELMAEGTLLTTCQLILLLAPEDRVGLAIHFPEKRIEALYHETSEFNLILSNAKAEMERQRERNASRGAAHATG